MSRETWLAERRGGIGGTDAAAILGVSKFATPYDVWLEKTRVLPPIEPNESMWWGSALEDLVAQRYMLDTGRKVWNPERIYYDEAWPVLRGTPDRLCIGEKRGVEIKTAGPYNAHQWGEEGTDQIPEAYLVQVCVYMAITGFPVWDVAVLIGGSDFRIYTVRRDERIETYIRKTLREWWESFVETELPPPITDADSISDSLARAFPREQFTSIEVTPDAESWALQLQIARDALARDERLKAEAENNLKAILGDAEGMANPNFKITWRAAKDSEKVNWKAVAQVALEFYEGCGHSAAEMIAQHTKAVPGSRRFVFASLVDGLTPTQAVKRLASIAGGSE